MAKPVIGNESADNDPPKFTPGSLESPKASNSVKPDEARLAKDSSLTKPGRGK